MTVVTWGAVPGASTYNIEFSYIRANGLPTGWIAHTYQHSGTSLRILEARPVANTPEPRVRVQSYGRGGTSGWSTAAEMMVNPGCF